MGEVAITDLRPIFFRAMDYGQKQQLLNDQTIQKLREEGAQMTINLSEKYYTVIHCADLWQATYNVCGIISLSLQKQTAGNLINAVKIIKAKGLVVLFREGWGMLSGLAQSIEAVGKISHYVYNRTYSYEKRIPKADLHSLERELMERFSAELDKNWIGWSEYQEIRKTIPLIEERDKFLWWIYKNFSQETKLLNLESVRDQDTMHKVRGELQDVLKTLFVSLIVHSNPICPLSLQDLKKIVSNDPKSFDIIDIRSVNFCEKIPIKWQSFFDQEFLEFQKDLAEVSKRMILERTEKVLEFLQNRFLVQLTPDEAIREEAHFKKLERRINKELAEEVKKRAE